MSYLTVPGQTSVVTVTVPAVAPQLSPEAKRAQTSAQARKRRATRLMKVGSFCSITSEGDGDIFDSAGTGQLKEEDEDEMEDEDLAAIMSSPVGGDATSPCSLSVNPDSDCSLSAGRSPVERKRKQSDPLSEYSEFVHDDCYSDISDLFGTAREDSVTSTTGMS